MPSYMPKPKSMCPGASCPGCSSENCYAEGGPTSSDADKAWNDQDKKDFSQGAQSGGPTASQAWSNLKSGLGYAEGGNVNDDTHRYDNEKGVHQVNISRYGPGVSEAGMHARGVKGQPMHPGSRADDEKFMAMKDHKRVLREIRSMKKPNLYAEGGQVSESHGEMPMEEGDHDMDQEIHHAIGGELMDALERKDKKGIMEALKAAVMECMNGDDE